MHLLEALEGLLFLCGDEGIQENEIETILKINKKEVEQLINQLIENYQLVGRGLRLEKYGEIYKLVTKKEYNDYYKKLVELNEKKPLTTAALEVLAIIAYNEPITRVMVDDIRGISSAHMIRKLQARELICEIGRSDLPGRPYLYKTTNKFLDAFGIKDLNQLPNIINNIVGQKEEMDLYKVKYIDNENEKKE